MNRKTLKIDKKGKTVIAVLAIIIVLVLATMLVRYLIGLKKDIIDTRPVVSCMTPDIKDIEVYTEQIGNISPEECVAVIPMLSGEVLETYFEVGDRVNEGDVLYKINSDSLKSLQFQIDSSKLQLDDAKTNLERTQALFAAGAASQQNLEQVQAMVEGYQIAYDGAMEQYSLQEKYSQPTAPISGIIDAKNVKPHDFVSPQGPAYVISGEGDATVTFGVNEESADAIEADEKVTVEVNGESYDAAVTEVSTMVGTGGLRQAKATIFNGSNITTGARGKVTLIKNRARGVMTIPMKSVYHAGNETFVYVLAGTKAVKKTFNPGIYDETDIEVIDGLADTDKVIYTWNKELYDGAEVIKADD